ncbi:unnamed protein product [Peronospora belbahrii]|uniref:Peptidase S33 tripeptidyl aminopeptidase-like C-terminal domain-containing protein n=1 Tax=Peronospora belbahrii TaxID=622444 RepID=A0ABN8CXI8_9STRA|nr:unnamed protein product [Peronospora belbahrii]
MDQRGTGRSTKLACVAAQVDFSFYASSVENDPARVPSCAQDIARKYGPLSSFSVTSAATDMAKIISGFLNGMNNIVYGYVLDGIGATPGAPPDEKLYLSNKDIYFGESTVCDKYGVGKYPANGIIYKPDEYCDKRPKIPTQASVLVLSSKLDPEAPHKYAKTFFEELVGVKKELVTFEYATQGALLNTRFGQGNFTCGMKLLMSYVTNDGNLKGLDKRCVAKVPALHWTPSPSDVRTS